jgi:hypothetical protein
MATAVVPVPSPRLSRDGTRPDHQVQADVRRTLEHYSYEHPPAGVDLPARDVGAGPVLLGDESGPPAVVGGPRHDLPHDRPWREDAAADLHFAVDGCRLDLMADLVDAQSEDLRGRGESLFVLQ